MKLSELLHRLLLKRIHGTDSVEIHNIEIDSRKVKRGDLFICLTGCTVDGHQFAEDAVARGAVAVLVEQELTLPPNVTQVIVPDTRRAMAILSDTFYGQPTHHLSLIGVTGTNGKTTTTNLIDHILNDNAKKTGLIGTIHMRIDDHVEKPANTTPEALELQRYFKMMLDRGAEYAVLEVSSHALDMGRVRGCQFQTAVFTNLTHDHLDYHKTMDGYRETKSLFFSGLGNTYEDRPKVAILNADDPASAWYAKRTAAQVITYGIEQPADIRARNITNTAEGISFVVDTYQGTADIQLQIPGLFNVYNAMAALAACLVEGLTLAQIQKSLLSFQGVRGRFEPVHAGQDFTVIVDYAHNPDGLRNVLQTAKSFTTGKLYCIVGCEGDRDREKRPVMAGVAATYSDLAILTSDNTRSEEPEEILQEMQRGLIEQQVPRDRYLAIADRRAAIQHAIRHAEQGDCVLIAGKGHETHQIVKNNQAIPFDDRAVALESLSNIYNPLLDENFYS